MTTTFHELLHKLVTTEVSIVVSTGYGHIQGQLTHIGTDFITIAGQRGTVHIPIPHIVVIQDLNTT